MSVLTTFIPYSQHKPFTIESVYLPSNITPKLGLLCNQIDSLTHSINHGRLAFLTISPLLWIDLDVIYGLPRIIYGSHY